MKNRYCIIMAGGVGSRFWPMSTSQKPKQFLDIFGTGKSMLRMTFERFQKHCVNENIWVVTNQEHKDMAMAQLPELKNDQILTEPYRRNTAPCIAYASYKIHAKDPDARMIISPADHQITNIEEFDKTINKGFEFISTNPDLLTLGIQPSRPETEYGYIQFEKDSINGEIKKVKTFTEKPNLKMAQVFLKSGEFLWNSGMFMWSAIAIRNAFKQHLPDLHNLFCKGDKYFYTPSEKTFIKEVYEVCQIISIDYGIMEKAQNVYVFKAKFDWSDIGTWNSLYEHSMKDEDQNVGKSKVIKFYDSKKCFVRSTTPNKWVVIEGLEDYIIVDTDDILLICRRKNEKNIRQFMNNVIMELGDDYV